MDNMAWFIVVTIVVNIVAVVMCWKAAISCDQAGMEGRRQMNLVLCALNVLFGVLNVLSLCHRLHLI